MATADHTLEKCLPHARCPAGQQLDGANTTYSGLCNACSSDEFRPLGDSESRRGEGKGEGSKALEGDDTGRARSLALKCSPRKLCQRGQFAASAGNATMDRVCTTCPAGMLLDQDNHTEVACGAPDATTAAPPVTVQPVTTRGTSSHQISTAPASQGSRLGSTATSPQPVTSQASSNSGGDGDKDSGGLGPAVYGTMGAAGAVLLCVLWVCCRSKRKHVDNAGELSEDDSVEMTRNEIFVKDAKKKAVKLTANELYDPTDGKVTEPPTTKANTYHRLSDVDREEGYLAVVLFPMPRSTWHPYLQDTPLSPVINPY